MRIVFERVNSGQFILVYKIMSKRHVSEKLFSVLQCTHSCMPLRNLWGLPLVWLIAVIKLPTSFRIVKAVFTLYKIQLSRRHENLTVSAISSHKWNGQVSARFLQQSEAALHCTYLKIESHIGQVFTFLEMETRATKKAGGELNAWRV